MGPEIHKFAFIPRITYTLANTSKRYSLMSLDHDS